MDSNKRKIEYIRNFIFGVEDSLVSTIGLVSGVAVAGASTKYVVLTGMVLIFVEAFSMGVGSLLSENSAEEFEGKKEVALSNDIGYAMVMFGSYLLSGFIIILPYLFMSNMPATITSIVVSLIGLFALGVWSAHMAGIVWFKRALSMSIIGGVTIVLGVVVGQVVNKLA